MTGVAFTRLFVANNLIGRIGGFYGSMRPVEFWALHAAIGAAGGVRVRAADGYCTSTTSAGRSDSESFEPASRSPAASSA